MRRSEFWLGSASAHRGGKLLKQGPGFGPVNAGVGDALAVDEGLAGRSFCAPATRLLSSMTPMMLGLPAAICAATSRQTMRLAVVVLVAVGVAAVDHDAGLKAGVLHGS